MTHADTSPKKDDEPPNRLARRARRALAERNWSLRDAERETGVNYSTVYNMTRGRNVEDARLVRFAEAIGEDPDAWLATAGRPFRVAAGGSAARPGGAVLVTPVAANLRLPVVGRIAAGTPVLAEQNVEEFVSVPRRWLPRGDEASHCYALTVRGDSMQGADIHDGDVLAVRMAETAEDGQVVVARIGGEVTVKRLRYVRPDAAAPDAPSVALLMSDPETYMAPIRVGADAAVIGLPVGYLRQKPSSWG